MEIREVGDMNFRGCPLYNVRIPIQYETLTYLVLSATYNPGIDETELHIVTEHTLEPFLRVLSIDNADRVVRSDILYEIRMAGDVRKDLREYYPKLNMRRTPSCRRGFV